MSRRSPSGTSSPATVSTTFRTGTLSPVRAASSISSVAATSRRPSAGILSPASNATTSPGTSSSAGTSRRSPPRRTCARITSIFCSAATLSAALPSWLRPRTAFRTVSPRITIPVLNSCSAAMLTIAAPTRTSCIRSRYWRRNACQAGSVAASASLFGPTSPRRRSTSAEESPWRGSTPSPLHVSSTVSPCQATTFRPVTSVGADVVIGSTPVSAPRARRRSASRC